MPRKVIFRPEAERELLHSYKWYEQRLPGLGESYLSSVDAVIDSIQKDPELHPIAHKHIRRALVRRFPFGVFYIVEPEQIIVLAVFHVKRDPKSWRRRA